MKILRLFRQIGLIVLLLTLSSTQSACSLFRPVADSDQVSAVAQHAEPEVQFTMTGFRYEIPLPNYSSPVIVTETHVQAKPGQRDIYELPAGFQLQSFVEKIFSGAKKTAAEPVEMGGELILAKIPETRAPAKLPRDTTQTQFCERINQRLSSVQYQECMAVKLMPTGHTSTGGKPILLSHFAQINGVIPTGRVLLIGGVHGDELSSVSIVFEWMQFLRNHHDGEFIWDVVPVMNPDGLFKDRPTRTNANGVDLNRNMPTVNWQGSAMAYWRDQAGSSPRKFPGFSPASESETRWLIEEIDRFQPDMIITVHAPHNLIDYDAPSRKNAPRRFGSLKGNLLGTYPGSLGTYAGVRRGIPVVTIELPSANIATSVSQAHDMWSDMLEWLGKTIPLENQQFMKNRHYANVKQS